MSRFLLLAAALALASCFGNPAFAQVVAPVAPAPGSWAETLTVWGPIFRTFMEWAWPVIFLPAIFALLKKFKQEQWSRTIDQAFHASISMADGVDPKDVAAGRLDKVAKEILNALMRQTIAASPIHTARAAAVGLRDMDSADAVVRVGKALEARLGATQIAAATAPPVTPIQASVSPASGG